MKQETNKTALLEGSCFGLLTSVHSFTVGDVEHRDNWISVKIRVHALSQFHLIFFDLFCIVSEDAVDNEKGVEHRPLTLVSFKVLDLSLVIVATRFVLETTQISIATESFESFLASQSRNYVAFSQINCKEGEIMKGVKMCTHFNGSPSLSSCEAKAGNERVGKRAQSTPLLLDSRGSIVSKIDLFLLWASIST